MTSDAVAQSQQVASTASDQAREVADSARTHVAQITKEVTVHGRGLFDETRQQVQHQAETQTLALAEALHRLGDQTQALVDGRPEDAGPWASTPSSGPTSSTPWAPPSRSATSTD